MATVLLVGCANGIVAWRRTVLHNRSIVYRCAIDGTVIATDDSSKAGELGKLLAIASHSVLLRGPITFVSSIEF